MDRRRFILSATSCAAVSLAAESPAQTEQCAQVFHPQFGQVVQCAVGLRLNRTPPQQCQNWCWAACCEAIFGMSGYRVDQLDFVRKVFGGNLTCSTATGPMIKYAIDGAWRDAAGHRFNAHCGIVMDTHMGVFHPQPLSVVWDELNAGRGLITGTLGHAVVITAMEYVRTPMGPQITAVIVRDPWPYSPNRRVMSPQEFYNVSFLATLQVY